MNRFPNPSSMPATNPKSTDDNLTKKVVIYNFGAVRNMIPLELQERFRNVLNRALDDILRIEPTSALNFKNAYFSQNHYHITCQDQSSVESLKKLLNTMRGWENTDLKLKVIEKKIDKPKSSRNDVVLNKFFDKLSKNEVGRNTPKNNKATLNQIDKSKQHSIKAGIPERNPVKSNYIGKQKTLMMTKIKDSSSPNKIYSSESNSLENSSQKKRIDRRNALRILKRFQNLPKKDLNENMKKSLAWAKTILDQNLDESRGKIPVQQINDSVIKRKQTTDQNIGDTKRTKNDSNVLSVMPAKPAKVGETLAITNPDKLVEKSSTDINLPVYPYQKKQRRNASRTLKRLQNILEKDLNETQKNRLSWAKNILEQNPIQNSSPDNKMLMQLTSIADSISKRKQSMDQNIADTKRVKIDSTSSNVNSVKAAEAIEQPKITPTILPQKSLNDNNLQPPNPTEHGHMISFSPSNLNIQSNKIDKNVSVATEIQKDIASQNVTPSKRTQRKHAKQVLKRLKNVAEEDLDERQKSRLTWAKGILEDNQNQKLSLDESYSKITVQETNITSNDSTAKHKQTMDQNDFGAKIDGTANETLITNESKTSDSLEAEPEDLNESTNIENIESTIQTSKPFKENKKRIVLAVIDKKDADGKILKKNWGKVESGLACNFLQVMDENPGPLPSCHDGGWHEGNLKLVICDDERSAKLYTIAIAKLAELWPGAKLECIPKDQIPRRPKARALIPVKELDSVLILELIKNSNPSIPTHNWKIINLEEQSKGVRYAHILLNEECLDHLASKNGIIYFGFTTIKLEINEEDKIIKNKQVEESRKSIGSISSLQEGDPKKSGAEIGCVQNSNEDTDITILEDIPVQISNFKTDCLTSGTNEGVELLATKIVCPSICPETELELAESDDKMDTAVQVLNSSLETTGEDELLDSEISCPLTYPNTKPEMEQCDDEKLDDVPIELSKPKNISSFSETTERDELVVVTEVGSPTTCTNIQPELEGLDSKSISSSFETEQNDLMATEIICASTFLDIESELGGCDVKMPEDVAIQHLKPKNGSLSAEMAELPGTETGCASTCLNTEQKLDEFNVEMKDDVRQSTSSDVFSSSGMTVQDSILPNSNIVILAGSDALLTEKCPKSCINISEKESMANDSDVIDAATFVSCPDNFMELSSTETSNPSLEQSNLQKNKGLSKNELSGEVSTLPSTDCKSDV